MPEDGETVDITQEPAETGLEVVESVEQRIELTETNRDSDVLNKGDSVIRRREVLTKKTGRRIAKVIENNAFRLQSNRFCYRYLSKEYLYLFFN